MQTGGRQRDDTRNGEGQCRGHLCLRVTRARAQPWLEPRRAHLQSGISKDGMSKSQVFLDSSGVGTVDSLPKPRMADKELAAGPLSYLSLTSSP